MPDTRSREHRGGPACHARRAWLRRGLLGGWVAATGCIAGPVRAHDGLGPVTPPQAAPALPLAVHDGRRTHLPALLQGRLTAVQLMFTGCSAICPMQGAIFAELQSLLSKPLPGAQLLSISIDPVSDDAAALAAWRARFGAKDAWLAAAPTVRHADALAGFFDGPGRARARAAGDRHSAQTYLFDARGRFAFRCAELASPSSIAVAMRQLAA